MIDLSDVRKAWNLAPILSTTTPPAGTIHQTLLLKTAAEEYVLRAYRYQAADRWRITSEHALIAHVHAQGLPSLPPFPLSNGETILQQGGRFYALFPFAHGSQTHRDKLTAEQVVDMGRFLGKLHLALQKYPHERVARRTFNFDRARTFVRIDKLEGIIRAKQERDDTDRHALAQLAHKRAWLIARPISSPPDISSLEQQTIHGDYQATNLFFAGNKVSAIIDWDQAYIAPRAWEVVRALHYICQLEPASCRTFLNAYRTVLSLTRAELELAGACYGLMRAHDLWLYETYYLEGNRRVSPYMPKGNARLFAEEWASLQHLL
jgi:homoserine kinase type II